MPLPRISSAAFAFFGFAYAAVPIASAIAQDVPRNLEEYASSLLESLLANNNALESYDVLIDRKQFYTKPNGELFNSESRYRLRRSEILSMNLFAKFIVRESVKEQASDGSSSRLSASIFGRGLPTVFHATEAGYLRGKAKLPIEQTRYRLGWPREETFGVVKFPHVEKVTRSDSAYWRMLTVPAHGVSATVNGNRATVRIQLTPPSGLTFTHAWTIDMETLMPSHRTITVKVPDQQPFVQERESYKWEDHAGVYVPKEIHCESMKVFVRENSTAERYVIYEDAEFNWKSVNAKMQPSDFSEKLLASRELIKEMLEINEDKALAAEAR